MSAASVIASAVGSSVWSSVNGIRSFLCRWGIIQPASLGCRVVSIGNLQAGGTGKTPLVAFLARESLERGILPCILMRGYRGRWEESGGIIGPGLAQNPTVDECGDEAALLHELVPEAFIVVGADRQNLYRKFQALLPSRHMVILDDGFQHLGIRRDVDIVLVTSDRWGRKLFREWPFATGRADLLVWTKGESRSPLLERFDGSKCKVRFLLPAARENRPIVLVSGVAGPEAVREAAERAGYRILEHRIFPDHATYTKADITGILDFAAARGAPVALTGKDFVKWRAFGVSRERVTVLEPEAVFEEGREEWLRMLWED